MYRGKNVGAAAILLGATACVTDAQHLQIRPVGAPLSASLSPVSARLNEARNQFALGSLGLAIESYRRALGDEPQNVDALAGLAASYDAMGRSDLARRYYEAGLAVAPGDARLLSALAESLYASGNKAAAAATRREVVQRTASAVRPALAVPRPPASSAEASADRAIDLSGPQPAALAAVASAAVRSVAPSVQPSITGKVAGQSMASAGTSLRLERLSLGEVALVTTPQPLWRPQLIAQSQRSTVIRFVPLRTAAVIAPPVRVLNAARLNGLAARTRTTLLTQGGWGGIKIGNAASTRRRSVVFYPLAHRDVANRIANQFGFALARRRSGMEVVVVLGFDAAGMPALRARG